jgi:DNA topoisomerase-3
MLYAKKIAQGKGLIIPDEAKANSAAMSAWIDSNRGTKRRKRGRKRAAIMRMKFSVHTGT